MFLYKVIKGSSGSSMGLECAKKVGFPAPILDRILKVSNAIISGAPIPRKVSTADVKKQAVARELCEMFDGGTEFDKIWCRIGQLAEYL